MKSLKCYFIIVILILSCISGCSKPNTNDNTANTRMNNETNSSPTPAPIQPVVVSPPSPEEISASLSTLYEKPESLLELAIILSNEMASGCFDYITELFDTTMHEKYSIETLYTDWKTTTEGFGNFVSLSDAKEHVEEDVSIISTILQYEHNNLLLSFTFSQDAVVTDFSFDCCNFETFSPN